MKRNTFIIAGGNKTLLVSDCPLEKRGEINQRYLGEVEQIGFVSYNSTTYPSLSMMGDELCINALIAFAYMMGGKGKIISGGTSDIISFNNDPLTSITIYLPYKRLKDAVIFPGIGYRFSKNKRKPTYMEMRKLIDKYDLPAVGQIFLEGNNITPHVYVKKTHSLIEESACGSGSIAASIFTGLSRITQPTGESIIVENKSSSFTVQARVARID